MEQKYCQSCGMPLSEEMLGTNVACIVLPDGSHFELVVFIKDASCDARACEEMMAQVARTVLYSRF